MNRVVTPWALLGALALLPACADSIVDDAPEARSAQQTSLDARFAAAATEFDVPVSLLKAIGYTETRWEMVEGHEEFEGMPPAFGIMALRGDRLTRGAALARVSAAQARTDVAANLRAAAALLSEYATAAGIDRATLDAWAPVVARYSGIEQEAGKAQYVQAGVYAAIEEGAVVRSPRGQIVASLAPARTAVAAPLYSMAGVQGIAAVDFPGAIWRPSPNYNARPAGDIGKVGMVIIHTCEGGYSGCWSYLTTTAAGTSAHYVVNEAGTEVSQLVREADRAYHIGATYDCSLNSSTECWRNGNSSNHFTVGIEHGGYASQTSFPAAQIDLSARLSCDISQGHNVPRDIYHFVAHGKLQPYNRTDPGPNWPWTTYLSKINTYCGSGQIIVDNNNANNNASVASYSASASWTTTTGTAGYYGSGYAYANTQAVSDAATFSFYLPSGGTRTIDAWWTSGTNRSTTTPFVISNASGTQLATVSKNQQTGGGAWNVIGTYAFTAGWNTVKVSRWTTAGSVVIADAIRVR